MALKYGSKPSGFGLRSGNKKGMPFKQMGSTPAKHGKSEDFQRGKKGHNPDTMSAEHEDFHAKQSGESPTQYKGVSPMNKLDDPSTGDQSSFNDDEDVKKTNIEEFKKQTVIVDGKTYKKGEEPEPKSKTGSEAIKELEKETTEKHGKLPWQEGYTEKDDAHKDDDTSLPDNVETKDDGEEKKEKWWKSNAFKEGMYNLAAITATDPSKRQMYLQKSQQYKKPAELTQEQKEDLAYKDNRRKIQELTIKQKQQQLDETTKTTAKDNDPTSEQVNIASRVQTKEFSEIEQAGLDARQAEREKEMDTKYGYLNTETGEWVPGTFMEEQKTTE